MPGARLRPDYREALRRGSLLSRLAAFDPHVAGTPPLGLDLPGSDIDVLCFAPDAIAFAAAVWDAFSEAPGFRMRQWRRGDRPVVAEFTLEGWPVEVFGQARPVAEQHGWRHFRVESRLLAMGGPPFRAAVKRHREAGRKTEPAFALVLGLAGDPHQALLELEARPDEVLRTALRFAGYRVIA
ncbi:DUF4269 domain-containing protein [Roseomonas sp. 18066]|uniref:DUF4269 domain-containing protein n=1 Tax=Roseomonas sp. 18066 TaxID=2681412 RepID=UPI0013596FBC|nr:DUF4269 domain-containing protein [Roseomonas sp. 18066]